MSKKKVKIMDKCDFCDDENETVGVYSTDFAPASMCYCYSCRRVPNLRTKVNMMWNWARRGDSYLTNERYHDPMVYYNGLYISGKIFIRELSSKYVEEYLGDSLKNIKDAVLEKLKERYEKHLGK